jgi:hypothetical protein
MTVRYFINAPTVTSAVEWDGTNVQEVVDWYAAHSLGDVGLEGGVLVSANDGELPVGTCISQYGWTIPPGGIPNRQQVAAEHVTFDTTPVEP